MWLEVKWCRDHSKDLSWTTWESSARRLKSRSGHARLAQSLAGDLVDTGSEYTWVPRRVLEDLGIRAQRTQAFEVADGRRIERDIGYALVRAGGMEAPDLVVFAEPGDMTLLGAHSLEG